MTDDKVKEAVAEIDAISCPLEGGKSYDRCPKCGATADQNCGPWVSAVSKLETAVRQALAHHSAPVGEPEDGQDRKFAFRSGQFVNRVSGEPIPKDEPIIIFRARDRHAMSVLAHYLDLAQDPHHQQAIRDRIAEFQAYREANPERLKEPGITRDITLSAPSTTPTSAPVEGVGGNAPTRGWDAAMHVAAAEARRYASFYKEASDGRNTFIIFAEWAEKQAAALSPSLIQPQAAPEGEGGWRPIAELTSPAAPVRVDVRTARTYRWLPYKPDGARQMKKAGRWQAASEYGWENAELPERGEFKPNQPQGEERS